MVGTILLLAVTIGLFVGFVIYLFSIDISPLEAHTDLAATTDGINHVFVKNMGGLPLDISDLAVSISINGTPSEYQLSLPLASPWSISGGNGQSDGELDIGEKLIFTYPVYRANISITVVSKEYRQIMLSGAIQGVSVPIIPAPYARSIYVTPESRLEASGEYFDLIVMIRDQYGAPFTGYSGTVHFESSSPSTTLLPSNYTFQPSDGGVRSFRVKDTPFLLPHAITITVSDIAKPTLSGSSGSIVIAIAYYPAIHTDLKGDLTNFTMMQNATDDGNHSTITEEAVLVPTSSDMILNGNFATDAGGWTETEILNANDGQTIWDSSGYSGGTGGSLREELTTKNRVYQAYRYQTLSITNATSVKLSLKWKKGYAAATPDYSRIYVTILKPDGTTTVDIWSHTTAPLAWNTWYSVTDSVVTSNFNQNGVYHIYLRCDLDTPNTNGATALAWFDEVKLNVTTTTNTYTADIKADFAVFPSVSNHQLQIGYSTSGESFYVYVWDGTTWNNRGTLTSMTPSVFYYDMTLSEAVTLGFPSIRFVDESPTDLLQHTLYIDYARVMSYD